MNVTYKAPSNINLSTSIVLYDGTTATVDTNGYTTVDSKYGNALEAAGWLPVLNSMDILPETKYTDMADVAAAVILAASMVARDATIDMAGTLTGGATLTLPTVAQLVAAIPEFVVGMQLKLRIVNSGAGAFAWTVTTATGWTLNGTQTIAQGAVRDFYITFQSATTATLTSRNG